MWAKPCQQHKRQHLVKPSKQTQWLSVITQRSSSSSSAPSSPASLSKHDRSPPLSKAGDRWNWWALQVQHETSGQAWVIGATNSVARAAANLRAVGPTLLIQLTSLTLGFKLRLWVYHQMLDLMIKILSPVVELSDVKRAKLTGCLSPLWTKHNAHWCTGWKSMDVKRPSGRASKAV